MTSPYSIYSANIVVITNKLLTRVGDGIGAGAYTLTNFPTFSTDDIYYGDQDLLPRTPSVCIEPNDKNRSLAGAPNMTDNEFEIYAMIYHNKVQSNATTRQEVDQLAYEIEAWIHKDLQLKLGTSTPALIHGFVVSNESGYTFKNNTLYRTARLTYKGKNKTSLAES